MELYFGRLGEREGAFLCMHSPLGEYVPAGHLPVGAERPVVAAYWPAGES